MTKQKNMNQMAILVIALLILMTAALVGLFQSSKILIGNSDKSIKIGQSAVLMASEEMGNNGNSMLLDSE